jgi:catechol 2,3-dioxygenase-like lactoylglutathione lyase family enzyme
VNIDLVTLVVHDYDVAIAFFVEGLGFDLIEDTPASTGEGRAKRWVVVALRIARRDYCLLVQTAIDRSTLSATRPEVESPSFFGLRIST